MPRKNENFVTIRFRLLADLAQQLAKHIVQSGYIYRRNERELPHWRKWATAIVMPSMTQFNKRNP
ncbi:MAG: hypothetical protein F6J86_42110 [Symploca sp. SIO1B1]|nr:hypothetical protein [Symploca sp. SIO1B1]